MERWTGKGRGPGAGSGLGVELSGMVLSGGEGWCRRGTVPAWLSPLLQVSSWVSSVTPPSFPENELHAVPSLSLIQPPPLGHILCSISLSSSARYSPPPSLRSHQIKVLSKTDSCFSLCPLLARMRIALSEAFSLHQFLP